MNANGITIRRSFFTINDVINRLHSTLLKHGATIYATIDQQAEANKGGQALLPLQFILFGNPKSGGPLMAGNPLIALDLPLKVIVWQDNEQQVWLAWNESTYIEKRYSLEPGMGTALNIDLLVNEALR